MKQAFAVQYSAVQWLALEVWNKRETSLCSAVQWIASEVWNKRETPICSAVVEMEKSE